MLRRTFLAGFAAPPARGVQPVFTVLWKAGEGGYHTYRIPALYSTRNSTLLAFCEGRRNDARDYGDIDLLVKRSDDSGRTWSAARVVHEEGGRGPITIGNPCPVEDERTGILWLPFCRDNDRVFVTSSRDQGETWTAPREITAEVKRPEWGWYATGPGIGIQIREGEYRGRLVIPCDHGWEKARYSHVFFSDDHGRSWQLGGSAEAHTNESQVVELVDGSLMLNMRNHLAKDGGRPRDGGCRAVSISRDGGQSWGLRELDRTLIEPVCQASLIRYSTGRIKRLLFANPASAKARERLTVRMSYDEGRSWDVTKLLHEGPAAYSSLARLRDGSIGILYECGATNFRETLTFARFPLEWLVTSS